MRTLSCFVLFAILTTGCTTTKTVEVAVPVVVKPTAQKCYVDIKSATLPPVGPERSLLVANMLKKNNACAAYYHAILHEAD